MNIEEFIIENTKADCLRRCDEACKKGAALEAELESIHYDDGCECMVVTYNTTVNHRKLNKFKRNGFANHTSVYATFNLRIDGGNAAPDELQMEMALKGYKIRKLHIGAGNYGLFIKIKEVHVFNRVILKQGRPKKGEPKWLPVAEWIRRYR